MERPLTQNTNVCYTCKQPVNESYCSLNDGSNRKFHDGGCLVVFLKKKDTYPINERQ